MLDAPGNEGVRRRLGLTPGVASLAHAGRPAAVDRVRLLRRRRL